MQHITNSNEASFKKHNEKLEFQMSMSSLLDCLVKYNTKKKLQ